MLTLRSALDKEGNSLCKDRMGGNYCVGLVVEWLWYTYRVGVPCSRDLPEIESQPGIYTHIYIYTYVYIYIYVCLKAPRLLRMVHTLPLPVPDPWMCGELGLLSMLYELMVDRHAIWKSQQE